jgi:hypothetical protein
LVLGSIAGIHGCPVPIGKVDRQIRMLIAIHTGLAFTNEAKRNAIFSPY